MVGIGEWMDRHGKLLGSMLAIALWAAPAAAGDWQPLTGDDPLSTGRQGGFVPRHWDVPRDTPVQPQPTPPAPAPRGGCSISVDTPEVRPGDYVTITIKLPDPVAHQLGRVDLLFPEGPVAGLVRHGHSYQYAWRAPDIEERTIPVRFVALARQSGYAGQPRVLCSGSTSIKVAPGLRVAISGGKKMPVGVKRGLRAEAKGGKEPLEFNWYVDGGHVASHTGYMARGGLSMLAHAFSPKGEHRVKVTVTDQKGESASAQTTITAYQCGLVLTGPSSVKAGDREVWTAEIRDGYSTYTYEMNWDDGGKSVHNETSNTAFRAPHVYAGAGRYSLRATAVDRNKCRAEVIREITVVAATRPAPNPAPTPAPGPAADPNDGGTCRSRDECPDGQVCLMVGRADFGVCATPGF